MEQLPWTLCNLYNRLCIERKKFGAPRTSTQMYIDYMRKSLDPVCVINAPSDEHLKSTMVMVGQCLLTINWAADAYYMFDHLLTQDPEMTEVYVWMSYACAMMHNYVDALMYSELFLELFFPSSLDFALVISGKAKVDAESPYVSWVLVAVAIRAYAYGVTRDLQNYHYNLAALVHIAVYSKINYVSATVDAHADVSRIFQRDTYASLVRAMVKDYVRMCVPKQGTKTGGSTLQSIVRGASLWLYHNDGNVKALRK